MKLPATVLLSLLVCVGVAALELEAEPQYGFAAALLERGEYFKAVLESERLLHFFPDDALADDAAYHLALAYDLAGEHPTATAAFRYFASAYPASELLPEARLALGRSLALSRRYEEARRELQELAEAVPPLATSGRAAVLRGLTYLPGADFASARRAFDWAAQRFDTDPAGVLAAELAALSARRDDLPNTSPALAGFLSGVVPGLGQAVCGRVGDGLVALFTNGLWIGATVWAASEEEIPTAVVTGLLGFSFYLGNIYNAGQAAVELNRRRTAALTAEIVAEVRAWETEHGTGLTLVPSQNR